MNNMNIEDFNNKQFDIFVYWIQDNGLKNQGMKH